MAAKSNLHGDVYLWLIKVIESCTTPLQLIGARKLVTKFSDRLPFELMVTLHRDLRDRLSKQETPDLHSPQGSRREDTPELSMGDGWKSASPEEKYLWNVNHNTELDWTKEPPRGTHTNPNKDYYGPLS